MCFLDLCPAFFLGFCCSFPHSEKNSPQRETLKDFLEYGCPREINIFNLDFVVVILWAYGSWLNYRITFHWLDWVVLPRKSINNLDKPEEGKCAETKSRYHQILDVKKQLLYSKWCWVLCRDCWWQIVNCPPKYFYIPFKFPDVPTLIQKPFYSQISFFFVMNAGTFEILFTLLTCLFNSQILSSFTSLNFLKEKPVFFTFSFVLMCLHYFLFHHVCLLSSQV